MYLFALRGFYALKDTRTPFLVNLAENGINIVLRPGPGRRASVAGAGPGLLVGLPRRRGGGAGAARRRKSGGSGRPTPAPRSARTLVAAAAMGAGRLAASADVGIVELVGRRRVRCWSPPWSAGVVYFGVLVLLRSDDVDGLTRRCGAWLRATG